MKRIRVTIALALFIGAMLLLASCNIGDFGSAATTTKSTTTAPVTTTTCAVHTWDDGFTTKAASCSEEGIRRYVCAVCYAIKEEALPLVEHTYEKAWTSDEDRHWHAATCSCRGTADEAEHEWDEEVETKPSTCLERGKKTYTCSVCSYKKVEWLPLLPHTYSDEWTAGSSSHWHEAICGCPFVDRADITEHTWDEGRVTTPATCGDYGVMTYTCTVCSFPRTELIRPTEEHTYIGTVTGPTCTAGGYTTYTCSVCEKTYKDNYTYKTAHPYEAVVTDPTCVAKGYTTHTCTVCGDSYKDTYTDTVDHDYKATVTAPTCTTYGYTLHRCTMCFDSYKNTYVDMLPHTYVSTVKAPTCTAKGYTFHECSECGDSYKDAYTDMLPHDYLSERTEPTCSEYGIIRYTCRDCGAKASETIIKLPHTEKTTVIPPTCTERGYTLHTCTVCDYEKKDSVTECLPHSYVDLFCTGCGKKEYSFDLDYTLSDDESYYIISGIGTCEDTELIIPHTHRGLPVREIAASAFVNNTDIVSVEFLQGGEHLCAIGQSAFSNCSKLADFDMYGCVSSIGAFAFENCSKLTSVELRDQVSFVGEQAFVGCSALEYFYVYQDNPNYRDDGSCLIETATKTVIAGCKNSVIPTDVNIVTRIASYAFYGCTELSTIKIPLNIEYIGNYAFAGCTSLTSVEFADYGGWYVNRTVGIYLGGTTSIAGAEHAAKMLTKYYENYYWYKKDVSA